MSHGYPLVAGAPFRPARMRKVVVIKASPDGRFLILGSSYGTLEAGFSCPFTLKMRLYFMGSASPASRDLRIGHS